MDTSRRDFLTIGAAGVVAAMATQAAAAEAGGQEPTGATAKPPGATTGVSVPADQRTRLVSFEARAGGPAQVGAVAQTGRVVPLPDYKSMLALIEGGPAALAQARKAAATGDAGLPMGEVRLLAPIPEIRRNIYAVGWNYLAHFEEGKALRLANQDLPEHPVFFSKAVHTLNGPFDPIPYDASVSTMIDWECELAVVIGKRGRNIAEADALSHVFGYTVINDTTARDLQQKKHGGQ